MRRSSFLLFFLFLTLFWNVGTGWAEPEVQVALNPSRNVNSGSVCRFSVEIAWNTKEADYRFSEPRLNLDNFTLEEAGESSEAFEKGGEPWKKKEFHFKLKALRPGKGRIQSFTLHYLDPVRQTGGEFPVESLEIRIVPDRTKIYRGLFIAGGVLALLLVSGVVLWKFRSKTSGAQLETEKTQSLEDRYLESFHQRVKDHASSPLSHDLVLELEKEFRRYLSEKSSLEDPALTYREFLSRLEGKFTAEELKTLRRIFGKLEEFHYATVPSFVGESRQLADEMIRFIEGKRIIE